MPLVSVLLIHYWDLVLALPTRTRIGACNTTSSFSGQLSTMKTATHLSMLHAGERPCAQLLA